MIRARSDASAKKLEAILPVIFIIFIFGALILPGVYYLINEEREERAAISAGKISAGYCSDLIDEDYKTVKAHFESAGFTNIKLIDLDDAGLAIWKKGKVKTISIGGNNSFASDDYFDPDTKVVISYH